MRLPRKKKKALKKQQSIWASEYPIYAVTSRRGTTITINGITYTVGYDPYEK